MTEARNSCLARLSAAHSPPGELASSPRTPAGWFSSKWTFNDGPPPAGWLESEKARLASHPAVTAAYVSAGGAGLHAVVAVSPIPTDRASYRQAWAWATRELALEDKGDPLVKDSVPG